MSLFKIFDVDHDLEKNGIIVDYDDCRFVIARAGGANSKFQSVYKALSKPYRYQIDKEILPKKVSEKLLAEIYADAVVLGAEARLKTGEDERGEPIWGEWQKNTLPTREGKELIPYTRENLVALLLDVQELFSDIQMMANKLANFKRAEDEEDAKN